jgi:tetratricopeptide (TPR) repeat protein
LTLLLAAACRTLPPPEPAAAEDAAFADAFAPDPSLPPSPESSPAEPPSPEPPTPSLELQRLSRLLAELGLGERDPAREEELFKDETRGGAWVRAALDAYLRRDDLRAVLFAQAAVGDDPGNETRRSLLAALLKRSGIEPDPQGLLPLPALLQHELRLSETAFFEQRYGASAQHSRRALLLDPDSAKAWQRLGSAQYALGQADEAGSAWRKALALDPSDERLRAFLREKGQLK